MAARTGTAHVVTTTRTYKDQVYRTHLLRRSYREDGKVKNETLGNLSHLPDELIEIIRRSLQGETFVPVSSAFQITRSRPHGHVQAAGAAMASLEMASLLASKPCAERALVLAMVAARIVAPHTKLATTRWWHTTTLAEDFGVADADEDDLYAAMDWLLERQDRIQKKLASRHLSPGGLVLYDLSSSYFEGSCCPLAKLGYSRDGKKGLLQVNYGLLTDARGCPLAVSVHEGNVADSQTLMPEVKRLREDFGIEQLVMVGDRGMISNKAIDEMRESDGIAWITALKSVSIRALVEQGQLQLDLFDERNLLELSSPDYPGERLVACRNPELAKLRTHKREELLAATEANLEKIKARVDAGKLAGKDEIGLRVGKVINQYKMAKHFELAIGDTAFTFARKTDAIAAEAALDGIYIIRTSVPPTQMDSADCVRNYKALANVERAFRSLKTIDLKVRPIHHRTADRVRAHIFLCMLAYYVEWHMREAWAPLMFADTDRRAKATRDPVAPATRSKAALAKAARHTLDDGTPVHSFSTLMAELATIARNTCRAPQAGPEAPTFEVLTTPNAKQQRALDLIQQIRL
ncbi:transposase [Variovorax sp. WS11]|uniref:IS1634 family transposase n=1 Tax=Variovorax sp. WS11 TaxID=1105204 RepID=UPI000D0DD00C|nr:IS1634 family transposase [Variovorax sp. WS11]NDZ11391.1 IS1634 family transposase [Variovorax sp. WS11]NDZ14165.1 IS1634 family transposase [Variovorax sp. WS11]NDZ15185.1 IS1634 family transposase [Variovorax sp. WS11]NDZ15398.1 IS1634 family transposase [Variovorax sp. WS11]NDZ18722.1 IS1634 family transposase [Variovorax sp. WS11]